MHISQYSSLAQHEELPAVIAAHRAGLEAQLPSSLNGTWGRAHIYSVVINNDVHKTFEVEMTGVDNEAILNALSAGIQGILEPGYDPDVIVGAGTTVTLEE